MKERVEDVGSCETTMFLTLETSSTVGYVGSLDHLTWGERTQKTPQRPRDDKADQVITLIVDSQNA